MQNKEEKWNTTGFRGSSETKLLKSRYIEEKNYKPKSQAKKGLVFQFISFISVSYQMFTVRAYATVWEMTPE